MDAGRFDRMTTEMAGGKVASRRGLLSGLLGGAIGLIAGTGASAGKRKRCKKDQKRCRGKCVNTHTDNKNCGTCGSRCAGGEQCLNGRCYSDDVCPARHQACPNFIECGAEDSECFCGTTTGGATVCFQDEAFCESPRPCQNNNDCEDGRVCIDSSRCCEDFMLPDVPQTCVLPCENLTAASAKSGKRAQKGSDGGQGPGRSRST